MSTTGTNTNAPVSLALQSLTLAEKKEYERLSECRILLLQQIEQSLQHAVNKEHALIQPGRIYSLEKSPLKVRGYTEIDIQNAGEDVGVSIIEVGFSIDNSPESLAMNVMKSINDSFAHELEMHATDAISYIYEKLMKGDFDGIQRISNKYCISIKLSSPYTDALPFQQLITKTAKEWGFEKTNFSDCMVIMQITKE